MASVRQTGMILAAATISFLLRPVSSVYAAAPGCVTISDGSGKNSVQSLGCLAEIVVRVIELAFMFVGAVTLLMLLYGSLRYITSGGDPKAVQGAQKTITFALIGMGVVIGSFVIIRMITETLGLPSILDSFTFYQS